MAQFEPARRAALAVVLLCVMAGWSAAPRAQGKDGPRLGDYSIVINETVQGLMVLKAGGAYEVYWTPGKVLRSRGTYRYDATAKRVIWLSGLNYDMGRGGSFDASADGSVHSIHLAPSTLAVNKAE